MAAVSQGADDDLCSTMSALSFGKKPEHMSHKKWKAHIKKMKRKKKRTELAIERDKNLPDEEAVTDSEEERLKEQREQEEEERSLRQNLLWMQREREAQAAFTAKKEWEEKERKRKEEVERKIKEEWAERERKDKEEQEAKDKKDAEKKEKQKKLLEEATANENKEPWHNPIGPVQYSEERNLDPCPFFKKTAACRFGEECSRHHEYPESSTTILIPRMFTSIELDQSVVDEFDTDMSLEFEETDLYQSFRDFYSDVVPEFKTVGTVVQVKVCSNCEPHLKGNVYVQYRRESSAQKAFEKFNARWYGGRQLTCIFVNIESWKAAICGLAFRKRCPKGKHCNFLHVFRNPGGEFADMDHDRPASERRDRGGRSRYGDENGRSWRRGNYHSDIRREERRSESVRSSRSYRDRESRSRFRSRSRERRREANKSRSRSRSKDRSSKHRHRSKSRSGSPNRLSISRHRSRSRSSERFSKSRRRHRSRSKERSSVFRDRSNSRSRSRETESKYNSNSRSPSKEKSFKAKRRRKSRSHSGDGCQKSKHRSRSKSEDRWHTPKHRSRSKSRDKISVANLKGSGKRQGETASRPSSTGRSSESSEAIPARDRSSENLVSSRACASERFGRSKSRSPGKHPPMKKTENGHSDARLSSSSSDSSSSPSNDSHSDHDSPLQSVTDKSKSQNVDKEDLQERNETPEARLSPTDGCGSDSHVKGPETTSSTRASLPSSDIKDCDDLPASKSTRSHKSREERSKKKRRKKRRLGSDDDDESGEEYVYVEKTKESL